MKKFASVLLLFTVFVSCKKELDQFTRFNLDYDFAFTIPEIGVVGLPVNFPTPPITTNTREQFEKNHTSVENIEEIKLTQMTLTIQQPPGQDFSFLSEIHIYIDAEGLDEMLIAKKENIPAEAGQQLALEPNDVDLKEYLKKDKISFRVETTTRKTTSQKTDIKADMTFRVNAKILGI